MKIDGPTAEIDIAKFAKARSFQGRIGEELVQIFKQDEGTRPIINTTR